MKRSELKNLIREAIHDIGWKKPKVISPGLYNLQETPDGSGWDETGITVKVGSKMDYMEALQKTLKKIGQNPEVTGFWRLVKAPKTKIISI